MLHCYYCIINLSIHTTGKIYRDSSLRSNRSGKIHQRYEKETTINFETFERTLTYSSIGLTYFFQKQIIFIFKLCLMHRLHFVFFYNSFFPPFLLFPLVYIFSSHFNSNFQPVNSSLLQFCNIDFFRCVSNVFLYFILIYLLSCQFFIITLSI